MTNLTATSPTPIWLQLSFAVQAAEQMQAEALLEEAGSIAITLADAADTPIFEPGPGETPVWPLLSLTALFAVPEHVEFEQFAQRLSGQVGSKLNDREMILARLEDQEWVRTCLADFQPIAITPKFWIVPTWHEVPDTAQWALRLDPGLAFGTGTHPTTFLCLQWLAALPENCSSILDYGCGSGILAIGAALRQRGAIVATDIDDQARLATLANASLNQVASRITFETPTQLREEKWQAKFDVLVANILAEPLQALAPHFAQLLQTGGKLCLSGILAKQAAAVRAAYATYFHEFELVQKEDWVRISALRI